MKKMNAASKILLLAGALLITSQAFPVFADTTANQNVTFSNRSVLSISLSGAANLSFPSVIAGENSDIANAASITGKSNQIWTATLSGTDFSSGVNTIPIERMSAKQSSTDTYTAISNEGIAIISNHARGTSITGIDYRLFLDYNDPLADNYQTTLTYTISN